MEQNNIITELGIIYGRDAIHVDEFSQKGANIKITGEISSQLCENGEKDFRWYAMEIKFKGVEVYRCEELDIYHWREWKTESNFVEILDSKWKQEYELDTEQYKFYILETYDYVYFILCKEFEFLITGKR